MNIFVLDRDPQLAARYHCDNHARKMIIEYGQLLSAAHHLHNSDVKGLYKLTHKHHPCTIWTTLSQANYRWLYRLFMFLASEYENRYCRKHQTYILLKDKLANPPEHQPDIGLTPFALAMPDFCKRDDPVESYRNYYLTEKYQLLQWTQPATVPPWVHELYFVVRRMIRDQERETQKLFQNPLPVKEI